MNVRVTYDSRRILREYFFFFPLIVNQSQGSIIDRAFDIFNGFL